MMASDMDLLRRLTTTPGIPGREGRIREVILDEIKGRFDSVTVDAMGSIHAVKTPTIAPPAGQQAPRVMLAAHMDQIGFFVQHVDSKGFLRLTPAGGFDPRNLFARMVTVCAESGDLPGVLNPAGKPIHTASPEDRKKVPEISEFFVDLGLSPEEAKEKVQIGDMVVLRSFFEEVGSLVVSQCMDNRVACWIAINAMRQIREHACEIHCVFTSQEEVGLRGALTAAAKVQPDIGIGIDTTLCVDTPGAPEEQQVTKGGAGATLTVMDGSYISDLGVFNEFDRVAKECDIPHQRSILPRGGTDSGAMQRAGSGSKVMTLSCPTRYIHTVTEAVHKTDLEACRDLLTAFLEKADFEKILNPLV